MKESLFEMLLTLFETTLLRIKEVSDAQLPRIPTNESNPDQLILDDHPLARDSFHLRVIRPASPDSIRVFIQAEQMKLTKSSQQFLMRLHTWGIMSREFVELVITRLLLSHSPIVSLQETKWTIRSLLSDQLSFEQLAYLDLVLYHKEDAIVRH